MKQQVGKSRDEWLIEEITRMRRELDEMKFNQSPTFNVGTATFGMDGTGIEVAAANIVTVEATADPTTGKLFPIPEFTIYKDGTATAANKYKKGSNWTASQRFNFTVDWRWDRNDSDGSDAVLYIELFNNTASSIFVGGQIRIRYLPYEITLS